MFEMIWNSAVDHIPLWGWLIIFGTPAAVALWYLSPILLPIWKIIPAPIKAFLIAAVAALLAYLGGRYKGRANAEEEDRRRNAEALQKRTEVDREVANLTDKQTADRLRDRWTRSDP